MFDHNKFDFNRLDRHIKEFAKSVVYQPIDFVREPTEFMFGKHVVDEEGYVDALFEEEERIWKTPFRIPVERRLILLDCVKNEVYVGCYNGRKFPAFEVLEVLFDSNIWGDEITLVQLCKAREVDGGVCDPEIELGEYDELIERLYKRIKAECDEKLNEYFRLKGVDH